MNDILMQFLIFLFLVFQGVGTRFSYLPTVYMQSRVNKKAFTFVTDILAALIGAAGMMLTCFLMAGEVRIFYALFYLGGIVIGHIILKKFTDSQRKKLDLKAKAGNALKAVTSKIKRGKAKPVKTMHNA